MKLMRSALALGLAFILAVPSVGFATNGMFLIGYGAKSRSMGGVGIGYTQDAIGGQMNPAGITSPKIDAMRIDVDAMVLYTPRSVGIPDNRTNPEFQGNVLTYDSGSNLFAIPAMGMIYKFNRKVTMGFSFVGSGGGNTRYTDPAPNGFNFLNPEERTDVTNTLGVNLAQAQMAINLAYQINKQNTVAIAPVIGIQTFRAYGLGLFKPFSSDQENMTNKGNDWAYGAGMRLGWQGKLMDRLTAGAVYTSKIYFTDFDKYAGLFAESGNLDAPANFGLGLSLDLTDDLILAFDWQRVFYSDVASINDPIDNLAMKSGFLGLPDGAGFGWEDQDIYKLGVKYSYNKEWDFAIGWNHNTNQIPKDQMLMSTLAPAVIKDHLTLGTTYRPSKATEWSLAYVHGFKNKVDGKADSGEIAPGKQQFQDQFPNAAGDGPGDMYLEMRQDSLEVSFTYKM